LLGPGHDKFLEFLGVFIDYTTTRSIHQQIDTYRVGVTKSSESTHHMLIEDVLETCIDRKFITEEFKRAGYTVNTEKCIDGLVPINNTALLIAKINNELKTNDCSNSDIPEFNVNIEIMNNTFKALIQEYANKYLIAVGKPAGLDGSVQVSDGDISVLIQILVRSFKIDYEHYYSMFEGGAEAITKDMVDRMVELAMTLEEDRYGKLHKLKRMLPEGFLQRRIMHCNYKALKQMLNQRFADQFDAWRIFCREIIMQVKHPEYFQDIFDKYHTSKEEIANNIWNGKPYIQGY